MKKYLFTLLLVTGITGAALACGKDKERKEITSQNNEKEADTALAESMAGTWHRTAISGAGRQAMYLNRDMRKSLYFSGDNARHLAGIEQLEPGALPAQLKRKLRKKYKGYRIAQVIRYKDGETGYFVSLEKNREIIMVSYAR